MVDSLGVLGLGASLPEQVRRNQDWPAELVEQWRAQRTWSPERAQSVIDAASHDGAARVLRAMEELADDPFQGARERHVLAAGQLVVELEELAAREAIADAGLVADDIDFVLASTLVPDLLNAPNVCALHERLGLRRDCYTLTADAVCNSFQMQLTLAEALVRSGRYRRGLLVQSSAASRTTPWEMPFSVKFGDGATAVVVGAVDQLHGLIAQAHHTDGTLNRAMVSTVRGTDWWKDGAIVSMPLDREASRRMFLSVCEIAAELIGRCYRISGLSAKDVDFFAAHQATVWWRRVVQEYLGLEHARSHDTYLVAGTLSGANLPLVLHQARKNGLLREGDLIAMYQAGTGATYSTSLFRWGGVRRDQP